MQTKPTDSAFPAICDPQKEQYIQVGLTKLEYFACEIMKAIISNPNSRNDYDGMTTTAILASKLLMKKLTEEQQKP